MTLLKSHKSFDGYTEFFEHTSKVNRATMKFSTYRPQDKNKIQGGIIWLSGLTCTDENFITKAGAQRLLSELNLAIICPDTSPRGLNLPGEHEDISFGSGAGFYLDATTPGYRDHYNMYSYVNDELYNIFNTLFALNGRISLMGHSMGGHGALTIGLRNPQKYRSISAFAPIVNPTASPWRGSTLSGYLGEDKSQWKIYDSCELIKAGHSHPQEILIDQGLADEFYPDRLLTKNLEEVTATSPQKITINYREDYDHSYYFISSFIESHIRYHLRYLQS